VSRYTAWIRIPATAALVALLLTACSSSKSNVVRSPVAPATTSAAPVTTSSAASSANPSSSGSKPRVTATVTPATGLTDKQMVQVVGAGFTPQEPLQVIECADKGTATGPGDCNLAGAQSVVSDPTGHVRAQLQVLRGPFGGSNIVCGPTQRCLVSVTQPTPVPTEEADVPIQFAS
jgi:Neocarzinostatin family